jgi:acid phosphatase
MTSELPAIHPGWIEFPALLRDSGHTAEQCPWAAESVCRATDLESEQGRREEAERAAARAKAHHFERVLIIVLENVDYERATRDPSLRDLATEGASFTNFHALFHPSYPNYLAMIAGTDFGLNRRGSFLGDRQVNFPSDSAHRTNAGRLIAAGLDFKQYGEELPPGTCPWNVSARHIADKRGNYVRRHVPFLSFREVQEKWCDHGIAVDSAKADNYFVQDAKKGLVAYSFYTPNMSHDGHDTNAEVAGAWVKSFSTRPSRKSSQGHAGRRDLRRIRGQRR